MAFGRKPESVNPAGSGGRGGRGRGGVLGDNFNRPTDVAWDSAGNIFVSDAYTNSRIVKLDKNGKFLKTWGSKGTAEGQFDMPNSLAVDAQGNVYVADLGNKRIQVFDNDGVFKTQFTDIGAPWAICISPGAHQYLFSSNSNPPDSFDNGEIYKMELDGKLLGKFGSRRQTGQTIRHRKRNRLPQSQSALRRRTYKLESSETYTAPVAALPKRRTLCRGAGLEFANAPR